jgi:signal transduction histidine kinase
MGLHVAPVDLARTVRLALAAAEADAGRDGEPRHTFALRVLDGAGRATEGPLLVAGDARLLREAADDLVENAVKYSPGGGTVEVTLRPVPSLTPDEGDTPERVGDGEEEGGAVPARVGTPHVELIVRDAGIGIPPDHLGRIFEPFHRVDTWLAREADGLGLGLALCRRIVELHRGSIWAESEPGSGSAFHVLLPVADAAGTAGDGDETALDGM